MNTFFSSVLPDLQFAAPEEMYVRIHNSMASISISEGIIYFQAGGRVSFDTYYNSLSIRKWKKSIIEDIFINIRGQGKFIFRIGVHSSQIPHRWIYDTIIEVEETTLHALPSFKDIGLDDGMLYFYMEALGQARVESYCLQTTTTPQMIKLGIVITHFNRLNYVMPALDRLKLKLLSDEYLASKIKIFVIDNSNNIGDVDCEDISIIPNKNLGGSGGFTRGLLELQRLGSYTHCLFMDDDASCEIESIKRALQICQYMPCQRTAVAGGLLRDKEPFRLVEKGAYFNKYVEPLKHGLDMRNVNDVILAENDDKLPNYGAWWFFLFPILPDLVYPFPFFVRGDDIRFGIENKFNIVTMNGVSCWGEDFSIKAGPMTAYLDTRSQLIQHALDNVSLAFSIMMVVKFALVQIFSYNYGSAKSITLAVKHFIQGPQFFINNIDMKVVREDLFDNVSSEKLKAIDLEGIYRRSLIDHESRYRKIIRILSANGFLLPNFLMRSDAVVQVKGYRAKFRQIFRFRRIVYFDNFSNTGYIAERNRLTSLQILKDLTVLIIKWVLLRKNILREYQLSRQTIMVPEFWDEIYTKGESI